MNAFRLAWPVVLCVTVGRQVALAEAPQATDAYGDPLPAGAALRLGTLRLREAENIRHVALSPDGKTVAAVLPLDSSVTLWDVKTGTRRLRLPSRGQACNQVAFSPDGTLLVGSLAYGQRFEA